MVTPAGSFTPSSQTFSNLTANATANFKAAPSIPPQCNTASFAAATNFAVGSGPLSVAIGDFNGDGKRDLAVANSNSNNVSILLGSGTGSFSAATNFAVGSLPFPSRLATSTVMARVIWRWRIRLQQRLDPAGFRDGQLQCGDQLRCGRRSYIPSRWATSMAMASLIWRWRIAIPITSRSCWAQARAASVRRPTSL